MKYFLKILGLVLLIVVAAVAVRYFYWRQATLEQQAMSSRVVATAAGPIEYAFTGDSGPVILFLHGTPGGFDHHPFFLPGALPGYRWLTPSRPGYLGTPLATGRTPAEQARAYADLLEVLGLDEVIVMSISGGGPSGVAFAAMYPEKTQAFVALESLLYPRTEDLDIPGVMRSDFLYWLGVGLISGIDNGRMLLGMFQLPEEDVEAVVNSPDGLDRLQAMVWAGWPAKARLAGWENDSVQFQTMALPLDQVRAPTLVLQGTADIQVNHDQISQIVGGMANVRFYSVAGGSHAMPLTHKAQLEAEIDGFLKEVLNTHAP